MMWLQTLSTWVVKRISYTVRQRSQKNKACTNLNKNADLLYIVTGPWPAGRPLVTVAIDFSLGLPAHKKIDNIYVDTCELE